MPAVNPTLNYCVKLELLFDQPNALPTIPKVVKSLVQTMGSADISVADMTRQIETDPVLTAKLLRLTNSVYFGVPKRVSSIEEAIQLLGFSTITTLIISTLVQQSFSSIPGTDLKPFWQYSIHAASLARRFARGAHVNEDAAFSAGLMHALGYLVMLSAMPDEVRRLDRSVPLLREDRAAVERERFGYTFIHVTEQLASRWGFPPIIISAIGSQTALEPDAVREPVACVLGMAVWRARCDALGWGDQQIADSFPGDLATGTALDVYDMTVRLPPQREMIGALGLLLQ